MNGLYKTELVRARPAWPSVTEVEFQTMNWVDWWNNKRLHEALDYATPTEIEAAYYRITQRRTGAHIDNGTEPRAVHPPPGQRAR